MGNGDHDRESDARADESPSDLLAKLRAQDAELQLTRAALAQAREEYAELFDLAPVAFLTLDDRGTILKANSKSESLLGVPAKVAIGFPLVDFLELSDRAAYQASRDEQIRVGADTWSCDARIHPKDVTARWARLHGVAGRSKEGMRIWRTVLHDIDDGKGAEAALRAREADQRTHFEQSRDARLVLAPPTFVIARANPSARALFGLSENAPRTELWSLAPETQPDGASSKELMTAAIASAMGDGPKVFEWVIRRASDSEVPTVVVLTRTLIEGEMVLEVIVHDQSEEKAMQARVAQAERLASIGLLAASVAHEVNNPLTYVLSHVDELASALPKVATVAAICAEALDETGARGTFAKMAGSEAELLDPERMSELAHYASEALEGTTRVVDIVKALGTFARPYSVALSNVDVNRTLDAAARMARSEMKHRAPLEKKLEAVPPVFANEGKLAQLFLNLFVNAAHAIQEGNVDANWIVVRTYSRDGSVFIEIRDSGKGIPKSQLPRVFEPFFTTRASGGGTGLGLAICANVVSELGGDLTVESEEGKGACFTVRLPIAPGATEADAISPRTASAMDLRGASSHPPPSLGAAAAATNAPESLAPPVAEAPPSARGRLLVIDDEPMIRTTIQRILRREHDVVLVGSGAEAQTLLASDDAFDAILCDLMMPEMSGMDLHGWVHARSADLASKMVFMTGGAFTEAGSAFLASSKNRMLDKPLDVTTLRKMVREIVDAKA